MLPQLVHTLSAQLEGCYPPGETKAIVRLLFEELFGVSQTDIYMGKDIHLSEDDEQKLGNIIRRLRKYEPIQYILGKARFCGREFRVGPHVLIPRPETEELIELILHQHPTPPSRMLDIGSGSGCIPITLSLNWKECYVESWDISPEALEIAAANNEAHGTDVHFTRHDALQPIARPIPESEAFDLIVSNPPYIKESERKEMEHNVLDWEPPLALFVPDNDPLMFYRAIAGQAADGLLRKGGWLYFEINREHGDEVAALMGDKGFRRVKVCPDLSGNDRIAIGML